MTRSSAWSLVVLKAYLQNHVSQYILKRLGFNRVKQNVAFILLRDESSTYLRI